MSTTPNLGMTKPATGDRSWGATMNANLDILDNITSVCIGLTGGTFSDSSAVVVLHTGTTNGTALGYSASDKLGFHGATPAIKSASANQAAVGTPATVTLTDSSGGTAATTLALLTNILTLTDSTGGTASTTLAAISDTATKNAIASLAAQLANQQAWNVVAQNAVASLAAQMIHAAADLTAHTTLLNQLRLDLVNKGLIKGSA